MQESVRDYVRDCVQDSERDYMRNHVWDSVRDYVRDFERQLPCGILSDSFRAGF